MVAPKKAKQSDAVANKVSIKKPTVKKESVKKSTVKRSTVKSKKVQMDNLPEREVAPEQNDCLLVLNPMSIINEAKSLHERLLKLSESAETVTIDVSKVETIDTAVFQLLLSFVSTMNKKNVKIIWHEPSEQFMERASLLNLIDDLYLVGAK